MALVFGLEGGQQWIDEGKRRSFSSWQDVVSCSGIEKIFHVYLKKKGSNVAAYGGGRGTAVAVLLQWVLAFKLRALQEIFCATERVFDVASCSVEWLKAFGPALVKYLPTLMRNFATRRVFLLLLMPVVN